MGAILAYNLIAHVIFGLVGVATFYAVWMMLLRDKLSLKWLKIFSFFGAASFVISWVTGGYYYLKFYGKSVKPLILSGKYPWAHTIITETKEHVFLILPFLAIAVFAVLWFLGEKMQNDRELKKRTAALSGLIFVLSATITFAGVAMSAAVK